MAQNRHEITVILKNGTIINICAERFEVNVQKLTGKIVSFSYTGCTDNYPLYIDIDEVAAIVQRLPAMEEADNDKN
jgi:hypothetical protein